jgi:hypothetical protein
MKHLGFRPYHMLEAVQRPSDFQYWNEALRAKFHGVGKPYGRVEFDKLLGEYDVCTPLYAEGVFLYKEGILTRAVQYRICRLVCLWTNLLLLTPTQELS